MTKLAERTTARSPRRADRIHRTTPTARTGPITRHSAAPAAPMSTAATGSRAVRYVFAGLRLALGWTFLWAFLDKTFGLGFATESANAWVNGGSPTLGFLKFGTSGPFAGFYQQMAGAVWADWLFMTGLAGIGAALLLGIGLRIAAATGALLYVLMWSAALPPTNNPFMDEHLIHGALLVALALVNAGDTLGLGRFWARLPLVQRMGWLR
jgi:thiosulfate dehydrogenase [quinone] large subunit